MTRLQQSLGIALFTFVCGLTPVAAADQARTQDRDRLQDGSCASASQPADQDRDRDRLHDGSCRL